MQYYGNGEEGWTRWEGAPSAEVACTTSRSGLDALTNSDVAMVSAPDPGGDDEPAPTLPCGGESTEPGPDESRVPAREGGSGWVGSGTDWSKTYSFHFNAPCDDSGHGNVYAIHGGIRAVRNHAAGLFISTTVV